MESVMAAVKRVFAAVFFILALACAAAAGRLVQYAAEATPIVPDEGPGGLTETVTHFFGALEREDWDAAYSDLSNYSTLGLEAVPEDRVAARFWQAQKDAWSFTVHPGYEVDGTRVTKRVTVRCLDIGAIAAPLGDDVQELLTEAVEQARLKSEVYTDDGSFREELVRAALDASVDEALRHTAEHTYERELTVYLRYLDGAWKIDADAEMLSVLTGGAFR